MAKLTAADLPLKSYFTRVTTFSLRKRRTGSLRVIIFADVQFSAQTQVKTKKKTKAISLADCDWASLIIAKPRLDLSI